MLKYDNYIIRIGKLLDKTKEEGIYEFVKTITEMLYESDSLSIDTQNYFISCWSTNFVADPTNVQKNLIGGLLFSDRNYIWKNI